MTRVVIPDGEYEMTRRGIRFRCATPWPRLREVVLVELGHGVRRAINDTRKWTMWARVIAVRVNGIGGDGWLDGLVIGVGSEYAISRLTALSGSNS